jgi:two-component system sensor histidine kinase ResE
MSPSILVQKRRSVRKNSLRTTLFFETFGLLVLTVLSIAVTAFFLSWNELKVRTNSQLQSIAAARETLLETTIAKQREQLSIVGRDPNLASRSSITDLVGFQELVQIDAAGELKRIAGTNTRILNDDALLSVVRSTAGTTFLPVITDEGWTEYIVASPQMTAGQRMGTLVAIFDATSLVSRIFSADYAGATSEVLLSTVLNGESIVLRLDESGRAVPIHEANTFFGEFHGQEGIAETRDYAGIRVLAALRTIPSLGWSVIVKIDRYEVRAPIVRLASNIAGAGLMTVVFLSLTAFLIGRKIVGPLEELSRKLDGLETKKWQFRRSIFTGNELEIVDVAATDLTGRLRNSYDHLEDLVRERTQELRKQHAEDAAILQTMDDGLLVTDDAGRIRYINRAAELLLGRNDVIGLHVVEVLLVKDKDGVTLDETLHPVAATLRTKQSFRPPVDPQFSLKRADGKETALQIRATPIVRGNTCLGVVTVIRDITEERRIDHMKSEFISLVSHQLRTPLSSMRWYLEMLVNEDAGKLTQDQRDYLGMVSTSNARMVHLVNALLNVSRIELGKFEVSPEPIDMEKLLRTAAASFDLELKQKNMKIEYVLPTTMVGLRTDQGLLQLIFENLISNAIKYSHPESSVTVTLSKDEPAGTATIVVSDKGIGIPEAQYEQIGKKLFRGSNAKVSDTDGNGLGLYISQLATETIGASLTFKSKEGEGTAFTLVLPLVPKHLQKN